jgi:hypothetical protein
MLGDVPERDRRRQEQAAVEDTGGSHQREQVGERSELIEVDEEQQQLRANERRDDDVDADIASRRPRRYEAASITPYE